MILPLKSYVNVIMNGNPENFGKIVGKDGKTLRFLQTNYNVLIIIPNVKDNKTFPFIQIINKSNNDENLDAATKHIINMLHD